MAYSHLFLYALATCCLFDPLSLPVSSPIALLVLLLLDASLPFQRQGQLRRWRRPGFHAKVVVVQSLFRREARVGIERQELLEQVQLVRTERREEAP